MSIRKDIQQDISKRACKLFSFSPLFLFYVNKHILICRWKKIRLFINVVSFRHEDSKYILCSAHGKRANCANYLLPQHSHEPSTHNQFDLPWWNLLMGVQVRLQ